MCSPIGARAPPRRYCRRLGLGGSKPPMTSQMDLFRERICNSLHGDKVGSAPRWAGQAHTAGVQVQHAGECRARCRSSAACRPGCPATRSAPHPVDGRWREFFVFEVLRSVICDVRSWQGPCPTEGGQWQRAVHGARLHATCHMQTCGGQSSPTSYHTATAANVLPPNALPLPAPPPLRPRAHSPQPTGNLTRPTRPPAGFFSPCFFF
jgi:hypothetical protein